MHVARSWIHGALNIILCIYCVYLNTLIIWLYTCFFFLFLMYDEWFKSNFKKRGIIMWLKEFVLMKKSASNRFPLQTYSMWKGLNFFLVCFILTFMWDSAKSLSDLGQSNPWLRSGISPFQEYLWQRGEIYFYFKNIQTIKNTLFLCEQESHFFPAQILRNVK